MLPFSEVRDIIQRIYLFLAGHMHVSSEPAETTTETTTQGVSVQSCLVAVCLFGGLFDLIAVPETTVQLIKHNCHA